MYSGNLYIDRTWFFWFNSIIMNEMTRGYAYYRLLTQKNVFGVLKDIFPE